MKELHKKALIHRDVSPNNILISKQHKYHSKLIDYGVAADCLFRHQTMAGTLNFIPPETLKSNYKYQTFFYDIF